MERETYGRGGNERRDKTPMTGSFCVALMDGGALCHSIKGRGVGGRLKKSKKKPARAGWPRRLALVRATSRAEVDVIGAQLCSYARAIFPS